MLHEALVGGPNHVEFEHHIAVSAEAPGSDKSTVLEYQSTRRSTIGNTSMWLAWLARMKRLTLDFHGTNGRLHDIRSTSCRVATNWGELGWKVARLYPLRITEKLRSRWKPVAGKSGG